MTFGILSVMAKAVMRLQWDQTSLLWATHANANRDPKQTPKPFTPADVHPLRSSKDYETEESGEPDWAMIAQIRNQNKVTTLNGRRRKQNHGGGSDPLVAGQ